MSVFGDWLGYWRCKWFAYVSISGDSLIAQLVRIHLQYRRPRFDSWVGKIPWRRAWLSTLIFWPEESPWTEEPGGLQSMGLQSQTRLSDGAQHAQYYTAITLQKDKWISTDMASISKSLFDPLLLQTLNTVIHTVHRHPWNSTHLFHRTHLLLLIETDAPFFPFLWNWGSQIFL